jgi:hypothetical protein
LPGITLSTTILQDQFGPSLTEYVGFFGWDKDDKEMKDAKREFKATMVK